MSESEHDPSMDPRRFVHGVDAQTGKYLVDPMDEASVAAHVGRKLDECSTKDRRRLRKEGIELQALAKQEDHRGRPPYGVNPKNLADTGWGIVYAKDINPKVKEALQPLIELRQGQAEKRFKSFDEDHQVFKETDKARCWTERQGLDFGAGNIDKIPYYLLLVGDLQQIPFGSDFDLGARYAVGRISFDQIEDYARYAENVVAAESLSPAADQVGRPGRWSIFAPTHPKDEATRGALRSLVEPLSKEFARHESWELESLVKSRANLARLRSLLGGNHRPDLFFFSGHGLGPEPKRSEAQGSLVCADSSLCGGVSMNHCFSTSKLSDEDLRGMVAVLFGCHTVGCPEFDSFKEPSERLLPSPAFSKLPQRMLSKKNGALAVLGHVDRAWSMSYRMGSNPQPETFRSVVHALLEGERLGFAAGFLGDRFHQASSDYGRLLQEFAETQKQPEGLTDSWMLEQDARSYLIFGDPAVRPMKQIG